MTSRRSYRVADPLRAAGVLLDEHSDVPPDMTLAEWRRAQRPLPAPRPRRRVLSLRQRRGGRPA